MWWLGGIRPRCSWLVVAGAGWLACSPVGAARPNGPADSSSSAESGRAAPNPAAAAAAQAESRLRITIWGGQVLLDGRATEVLDPGAVRRADQLYRALRARGSEAQAAYTLRVQPSATAAQLLTVLQTAGLAGWHEAHMELEGTEVVLHAPVPTRQRGAPVEWPDRPLALVIREDATELWRVPDPPGGQSEPPRLIATLGGSAAAATSAITEDCARPGACDRLLLYVEISADCSRVLGGLRSVLQASPRSPRQRVDVRFRLRPAPALGTHTGIGDDVPNVSGRLAPEVIQARLREAHGKFRECYRAGLVQDPTLAGTVVLSFVIGTTGEVTGAEVDDRTTLGDRAVAACVARELRAVTFPSPAGGVVTVVYPVRFEPSIVRD